MLTARRCRSRRTLTGGEAEHPHAPVAVRSKFLDLAAPVWGRGRAETQTRTIARRPVVLFGSDFWNPLWQVLRAQMVAGTRKTIDEEDLQLVIITDDPAHAAELCLGAR